MTAAERQERTRRADAAAAAAYRDAGGPRTGAALVAVGGYGRGELAPCSDLDLVLVHDDDVDPGACALDLWYPLWDSGHRVDHSVRSVTGAREAARADLRAALGLLDVRHLAGDPHLTLRLRTTLLTDWRSHARSRLPGLADLVRRRHARVGELAHLSVPDLKEAAGGLRDAVVLKALVATWLVDVPHPDLERARRTLLDVRDVLHDLTGRATDRIGPEWWPDLAESWELSGPEEAQRLVREQARRLAHLDRLAWRRVEAALARPRSGPRGPRMTVLDGGVAESGGEVVLDGTVAPEKDPLLLLRCAAVAAEQDLLLSPVTAARLARQSPGLPDPWPTEARRLWVRLLAAGEGLRAVWETLDETGALHRLLPEWEGIRLLPHASVVHRYTVDRHVVETCVEASRLVSAVGRPDLLLVAAVLHDIGKGEPGDHSAAGEPLARRAATRMGFAPPDVDRIATLVRRHLLLPELATTRDPDDPATVARAAGLLGEEESVRLLLALTEADARATSEQAWTSWRAGLVRRLAARVVSALQSDRGGHPARGGGLVPGPEEPSVEVPDAVRTDPHEVHVAVRPTTDGSQVTVVSGDRVGLLADVAATLALQRAPVRAARAWSQDRFAVSTWEVGDSDPLDPALLRHQLLAVAGGRADLRTRLARPRPPRWEPVVVARPEESRSATVLEVRTEDWPGVVHRVCSVLASLDVSVRSAHVSTLGPQVVAVFYLQEEGAGALAEDRAAEAAHAVRHHLDDAAGTASGMVG